MLHRDIADVRVAHEMEVDEMKKKMELEKENHDVTVRKIEETVKEVTDRMNAVMLAKKEFSDERIANLTKSLNEAKVYRGENIVLKTKMEEMEKSSKSLALSHQGLVSSIGQLEKENKDYTQQICQLTLTIDQFVVSKNETIKQMSALEDDVSAKKAVIDEITAENRNKEKLLEEKIAQSDDLAEQLRRSKAENDELKAAIQDLVASNKEHITQITMLKDDVAVRTSMADKIFESKNTNHANELENLMSSLHEVVELNGELQSRAEQVSAANVELEEANKVGEEKNAELRDIIECLTISINDERSAHEAEVDEMKKLMAVEKENHDVTLREFDEALLEEVTDRMNDEMLAQREYSNESTANLTNSLNEARVYRDNVSGQNVVLKTRMEELKKSSASSYHGLASSMSQHEKDLNEEFQITTELKTGTEKLISKLNDDKDDSDYVAWETCA
jgi:DNA repair exonuclease SbcCD ATPase subunit